tara:strand:- start:654 stop:905 length:252 start_codon:yes stop_codon:yes gene_type:complete
MITISGCKDNQTSADAYNVMEKRKFTGALTSCMLLTLEDYEFSKKVEIFALIEKIRQILKEKGFSQIPQVCSSFELDKDSQLF